jgi:S-formylglutathione hydrolase FrmB
MSLLGTSVLLLAGALSVLVLAACWLAWNRWPDVLRVPGRALSLLLVMAMGAGSAATYANHVYGFYSSFADLFGSVPAQRYQPPSSFGVPAGAASLQVLTPDWQPLVESDAQHGHGTVLDVSFPGPTSGIDRPGLLYLPAAYALGSQRADLPVIEMFNGYPGSPHNITRNLNVAATLDTEIAANRMPPVIVAIPTVYAFRSSECVDAAPSGGGEKDETYLAVDVPADVEAAFRAGRGRAFGALGYSEGGFCAANLGLHHPDRYAAVASLSGYFTAAEDHSARHLYGKGMATLNRNSPLWWVRHRAPTGPAMFLMGSTGDPSSLREIRTFRATALRYARRLHVVTGLVHGGGHNFKTWRRALPAALDFIGSRLPAPLAPPLTLPPVSQPVRPVAATPTGTPTSTGTATPRSSAPTPRSSGTGRPTQGPPVRRPRATATRPAATPSR